MDDHSRFFGNCIIGDNHPGHLVGKKDDGRVKRLVNKKEAQMQGIIGAFLGFIISLLISLVLNQPGGMQNISLLTAQPIYILFT
jgi:hypothetical protein